jgi:hypothetical protein
MKVSGQLHDAVTNGYEAGKTPIFVVNRNVPCTVDKYSFLCTA